MFDMDGIPVSDLLKAPWTPENIAKLDARQADQTKHPYTCGCGHNLEPSESGWYCEHQCGYTQNWCHRADAT